jgi:hypothetical protein
MKFALALLLIPFTVSADDQLQRGMEALRSMTGCYLIDYSYTETEALLPGYAKDNRVYDVNKDKSVKEWIYLIEHRPGKVRLQHILFATDLNGALFEGTELRHQAEDWEFNAPFVYDFVSPLHWDVKNLGNNNLWTRRITGLDDGLRYQCAAAWSQNSKYPEWTCNNFAPIPGRETRDMGRKDYNTLDRTTRIVAYGNSWLERQNNVKTIHKDGVRTPLAKEVGKNWYVRLPDSECAPAMAFKSPREGFWNVLRETWDEVFTGQSSFVEKALQPSRYFKIMSLEDKYLNMQDSQKAQARQEILDIINEYRAN